MKSKNFLRITAALLLSASLAGLALAADQPTPSPSPAAAGASPGGKRTMSPEARSKALLTRLTNEASLTASQQTKAKPIVDKYVADNMAVLNDATLDTAAKKAKHEQLKQQYDTDVTALMNAVQKKKYAAAEAANKARLEAGRQKRAAARAAAGAVAPSPTPKAGQ